MKIELYKKRTYLVNKYTRGLFFLVGDTIALFFAATLVYMLLSRFTSETRPYPIEHSLIIIASVLIGLTLFRMYVVSWKYISLRDLVRIVLGITSGGVLSLIIARQYLFMGSYEYTYTLLVLMTGILAIGGFRISKRIYKGVLFYPGKAKKHTIIFGAANEGEQILRDILINHHWNLSVYAIFDDRAIAGLRLHGVRIMGGRNDMINYIRCNPVDQLIVAFPQFPKKDLKAVVEEVKNIRPETDIKILPSFHSLTDKPVGIENIRDISIEDILGRKPVDIDIDSIRESIAGKTVLVTGAGGSIGSELVRQCANLKPAQLIALDIDETELFHLENEFKTKGLAVIPCVASITDRLKLDRILAHFKPDVIFHAAAYKHVPMMELFPEEAIKVNIGGTQTLVSLACKHRVKKMVMVSTDKAVNPTNVMGATKRVAEEICMAQNDLSVTKFISVRFGNVLGSRGSVVPLFMKQINNGGPVTVTDPAMERFFMTIPEAVLLVMQAGSMGKGGEVFILNMGAPVKIIDMAKDLIRLHNLSPDKDIDIEFIGLRPGEKLFEELLDAEEGVLETAHSEISKAFCSRKISRKELDNKIADLFNLLDDANAENIRNQLKAIVPTYSYQQIKKATDYLSQKSFSSVLSE